TLFRSLPPSRGGRRPRQETPRERVARSARWLRCRSFRGLPLVQLVNEAVGLILSQQLLEGIQVGMSASPHGGLAGRTVPHSLNRVLIESRHLGAVDQLRDPFLDALARLVDRGAFCRRRLL